MRNLLLALLVLVLTAPALGATEDRPPEDVLPEVVPAAVTAAEPAPDDAMHLEEIALEERPVSDDAGDAQLGPRGGFWWIVGVIVVAGVILALVL